MPDAAAAQIASGAGAPRSGASAPRVPALGRVRAVFVKEVWVLNKRPSTGWTRLLLASVTAGLCVLALLASTSDAGTSASQVAQNAQEAGKAITIAVVLSQFVLLTLVGASFAGVAIYEERASGALGTLLTTPIRGWELVLGKVLGRSSELLILLLLSAPLLLAFRGMGGVSPQVLLGALALVLSALMVAVCWGVAVSSRATSSSRAVTGAISVLVMLWLALPLLLMLAWSLGRLAGYTPAIPIEAIIAVISTPFVLMTLLTDISGARGVGVEWMLLWNVGLNALWSALGFLAATLRVRSITRTGAAGIAKPARRRRSRRAAEPPAAAQPVVQDQSAQPASSDAATQHPRRASRVRTAHAGSSRVVGDNPVLWRELQQPIFSTKLARWATIIALPALMLLAYIASNLDAMVEVGTIIGLFVALAFATTAATGALASEREARTLETLQATPLPPRSLVLGKYLPALRPPALVLVIVLVNALLAGVLAVPLGAALEVINLLLSQRSWSSPDPWHPGVLLMLPLVFVPPVLAVTALGLWLGSVAKKAATATIATIGCVVGAWMLAPLTAAIAGEIFGNSIASDFTLILNPFVMMGGVLSNEGGLPDLPTRSGWGGDEGVTSALALLGYVGAYAAVTWFCLRRAGRAVRTVRAGKS